MTRHGALVVQAPLNTLQSQRPKATLPTGMRFESSLVTKYGITSGEVINRWHGGSPTVKVTKITVLGWPGI